MDRTGSGNLLANKLNIDSSGDAYTDIAGSGDLLANNLTIDSSGVYEVAGSANLSANELTIDSSGDVYTNITGSGDLSASSLTSEGSAVFVDYVETLTLKQSGGDFDNVAEIASYMRSHTDRGYRILIEGGDPYLKWAGEWYISYNGMTPYLNDVTLEIDPDDLAQGKKAYIQGGYYLTKSSTLGDDVTITFKNLIMSEGANANHRSIFYTVISKHIVENCLLLTNYNGIFASGRYAETDIYNSTIVYAINDDRLFISENAGGGSGGGISCNIYNSLVLCYQDYEDVKLRPTGSGTSPSAAINSCIYNLASSYDAEFIFLTETDCIEGSDPLLTGPNILTDNGWVQLNDLVDKDFNISTVDSPLVGAGNNDYKTDIDLNGKVRPSGFNVDIGAFEFPDREGAGDASFKNSTISGSGDVIIDGSGSLQFNNLEISAIGKHQIRGEGSLIVSNKMYSSPDSSGLATKESDDINFDLNNLSIESDNNYATHSGSGNCAFDNLSIDGDGVEISEQYFTIGDRSATSVTASSVSKVNNNLWEISLSSSPDLSSVKVHDKYTDGDGEEWLIESIDDDDDKITVSNQLMNSVEPVTGSSIGPWYSSWTAFVSAEAEDLTAISMKKYAEFCDDWSSGYNEEGTSNLKIQTSDGWASDENYYLTVRALSSDRHDGTVDGDGFYIKSGYSGSDSVISIYDLDYTVIDGIKLDLSNTISNSVEGITIHGDGSSGSNSCEIKNCLVYSGISKNMSSGSLIRAVSNNGTGSDYYIHDNFVVGNDNVLYGIFGYGTGLTSQYRAGRIYNNTVGKCDIGIRIEIASGSYKHEVKNNYSFSSDTDDYSFNGYSNFISEFDYNVSSDNTAGNNNNNHNNSSPTTGAYIEDMTDGYEDFHIQTISEIRNWGIGVSSDSNVYDTDIDGDTRIGATTSVGGDDNLGLKLVSGSGSVTSSSLSILSNAKASHVSENDVLASSNLEINSDGFMNSNMFGGGNLLASELLADTGVNALDTNIEFSESIIDGTGKCPVKGSGSLDSNHLIISGETENIPVSTKGDQILEANKLQVNSGVGSRINEGTGELIAFEADINGNNFTVGRPVYSVGKDTSDLKTGAPVATIQNAVITFSIDQTHTNIVSGDEVTYDGSKKCYLKEKLSNNRWSVVSNIGGYVTNEISEVTVNSIKHVFNSISDAFNSSTGATSSSYLNSNDLTDSTGINVMLDIICSNDLHSDGSRYPDDTDSVLINNIVTDTYNRIQIYTPFIADDGITSGIAYGNREIHQTNGLPNTGYVLNVSSGSALYFIDANVVIQGLEIAGSCDYGIRIGYSSRPGSLGNWNIRVRYCLIRNTGNYGIYFDQGGGVIMNASSWNNIIYGQNTAGLYCDVIQCYSYNDTIYDVKNGSGTGKGIENGGRYLDIGNTAIFNCDDDIGGWTPRSIMYSCGEDEDFNPLNESAATWTSPFAGKDDYQRTNFIITQTDDDYGEMVTDVSQYNFNPTNRRSELFLTGGWDSEIGTRSGESFKYDIAGTKRFKPYVTIGALELPIILELTSQSIQRIYQEKILFDGSSYESGIFELYTYGKKIFLRPPSYLDNDSERKEYVRESKIIMELKDLKNNYKLKSDKKHELVLEVTAFYDVKNNSLIFNKLNKFYSGILYNLISNRKYKLYFNEQTSTLKIYRRKIEKESLSGNMSVIRNIRMGNSNTLKL